MSTWMMVREEGAGPTAGLGGGAAETDAGRDGGEGADHEADVLVEVDPELLRPPIHVVAIHRPRETLVLELLLHRPRLQAGDGAPGPHEGTGSDEARQLVTGIETPVEERHTGEARIVGMGEDGVHDLGGGTAGKEDLRALHGVVRCLRVHLVVEVVEHARHAPTLRVLAVAPGVGAHSRLHGQGMLAETVRVRELGEEGPRSGPIHHACRRARHLSMDFLEKSHCPSCSRAGMRRSEAICLSVSASMERYVEASFTVMVSLGITCQRPP